MSRHAVISGAGIAGPALAHQLAGRGWQTTVIERFPERRDEGQNIDVRGAAREVVRRMGIEEDLRAANTGEIGMRFLDENGSPAASFPMSAPLVIAIPWAPVEVVIARVEGIQSAQSDGSLADRTNVVFVDRRNNASQISENRRGSGSGLVIQHSADEDVSRGLAIDAVLVLIHRFADLVDDIGPIEIV